MGSQEEAAVALAALVLENERAAGKTISSKDIFRTYAQSLRQVLTISARLNARGKGKDGQAQQRVKYVVPEA